MTTPSATTPLRRFVLNLTDGPFGSKLTGSHYSDRGARVVRLGNIGEAKFKAIDEAYIPMEYFEELQPYSVVPGDLLIAGLGDSKNPAGRACLVPEGIGPAIVKADCYRARLDERRLLHRFAVWALNSKAANYQVLALSRGSTRGRINLDMARAIEIPAPSLEVQRLTADYLDRETSLIDTLVEEQQRLIDILRERRAAAISAALKPSESWMRRRVKYFGKSSLGKMLDAGRAVRQGDTLRPYVRAADVRADGSINLSNLNQMPFSSEEMDTFDLRAGDVLLIEGGATVGRPGFLSEAAPGIAFQKTVNRLRVGPTTDCRFVYWSMVCLYEAAFYANHYGSVSFVHLTGEKLREVELFFPSLSEQREIASRLDEETDRIDALIVEVEGFIELARERRVALITAAVTGQIDVREMA